MQSLVSEKPYVPVPPYRGKLWPRMLNRWLPRYLRKSFGVMKVDCVHVERLSESLRAGHGIVLAPNHCRTEDPFVVGALALQLKTPFFFLASAHLFTGGGLKPFLLRRAGAFSIYREGIDRAAVNTSIDILERADRPLVIFPEGFIARTNDKLNDLMEGTALIARTAAKKRAKLTPAGKVVCHPVAVRYHFGGDIAKTAGTVLDEIETRLSWRVDRTGSLVDRVWKVGSALLGLKEMQYIGATQTGTLNERRLCLIEAILGPMEKEWSDDDHSGSVNARVKRLRSAILPDMISGELAEPERARRWQQLEDVYMANELSHYPQDYVCEGCPPEHILETVERFEEDLTDKIRIHGDITATVTVGTAIEVSPGREGRGAADPLLMQIGEQLRSMLGIQEPAASIGPSSAVEASPRKDLAQPT